MEFSLKISSISVSAGPERINTFKHKKQLYMDLALDYLNDVFDLATSVNL